MPRKKIAVAPVAPPEPPVSPEVAALRAELGEQLRQAVTAQCDAERAFEAGVGEVRCRPTPEGCAALSPLADAFRLARAERTSLERALAEAYGVRGWTT